MSAHSVSVYDDNSLYIILQRQTGEHVMTRLAMISDAEHIVNVIHSHLVNVVKLDIK